MQLALTDAIELDRRLLYDRAHSSLSTRLLLTSAESYIEACIYTQGAYASLQPSLYIYTYRVIYRRDGLVAILYQITLLDVTRFIDDLVRQRRVVSSRERNVPIGGYRHRRVAAETAFAIAGQIVIDSHRLSSFLRSALEHASSSWRSRQEFATNPESCSSCRQYNSIYTSLPCQRHRDSPFLLDHVPYFFLLLFFTFTVFFCMSCTFSIHSSFSFRHRFFPTTRCVKIKTLQCLHLL